MSRTRAIEVLLGAIFALAANPGLAEMVPFTGTLNLEINDMTVLGVPGSGVATVNRSGAQDPITHLTLPAGAFGTALNPEPIVLSGAGCTRQDVRVGCPGTGLNGFGALSGFATGTSRGGGPLVLSLTAVGGSAADPTVGGAGWTTGVVSALTHSVAGGDRTVQLATGSRQTSPSGFGSDRVSLVTPISMLSSDASGNLFDFGFARISIRFVPEPAGLLLAAAAGATLALCYRFPGR